jgi:hypothetical protein
VNRSRHAPSPLGAHRDARSRRPSRRGAGARDNAQRLPLAASGVPAAVPGAAPVSPAVAISEASRARYPWLPARVIAGSVWRGPAHERVKVDANGDASPWPPLRP